MDDRELRVSIDHESKIRDQIAALTGKLKDVLDRPETGPSLPMLKEIEEEEGTKKKPPKKKKSLKDGPKRTISLQLPPEIFEKIQQDELRDDMEANASLDEFMASQGLDAYTNLLKRRGFNTVNDLANLQEGDIDFKIKPVHRSRLLWVAGTQKGFMEEDGKEVPKTEKVKPTTPDPEDKPKPKPVRKTAAGAARRPGPGQRKPAPGKKPPPGAKRPAPSKPQPRPRPGAKPAPTKKPTSKATAPPPAAAEPPKPTPKPSKAEAPVEPDAPPPAPVEPQVAEPVEELVDLPPEVEGEDEYLPEPQHAEVEDPGLHGDILEEDNPHMHKMADDYEDDYPIIENGVPGVDLPPQPENITRLVFGSGPFGITVYGTGNGLVVTHVEPEGSGAELRVEVGDHVVELNGVEVPPSISDREFVEQLMSKSRPVVLGFTRNGKDFATANAELAGGVTAPPEFEEPEIPEPYTVGGISMDEIDPDKNLADLFPSAGLEMYLDALKEMGAEKMEDLAYLRRSDLMDLDIDIAPADKKKLLELGLVAFLTKEGLADCVAYIRSVGVDMVDDLVYLKQSDVALMDLKQEYKDRLMDVLGRDS
uniref:PDZ domain-containing protein n=1 Tax=Rhizochromulina marina TaxID=1034831 RepID=A0A7S2RRG8_9STRA